MGNDETERTRHEKAYVYQTREWAMSGNWPVRGAGFKMKIQTLLAGIGVLGCGLLARPAPAAGQQDEGFPDVPKTHWAYEAVTDLKRRGILVGYPPETATPAPKKPAPAENRPRRRRTPSVRTRK